MLIAFTFGSRYHTHTRAELLDSNESVTQKYYFEIGKNSWNRRKKVTFSRLFF